MSCQNGLAIGTIFIVGGCVTSLHLLLYRYLAVSSNSVDFPLWSKLLLGFNYMHPLAAFVFTATATTNTKRTIYEWAKVRSSLPCICRLIIFIFFLFNLSPVRAFNCGNLVIIGKEKNQHVLGWKFITSRIIGSYDNADFRVPTPAITTKRKHPYIENIRTQAKEYFRNTVVSPPLYCQFLTSGLMIKWNVWKRP